MSHLTEGQLHAYLDGSAEGLGGAGIDGAQAHLAACADCRRRLETAGAVKEEAAGILGSAAPASYSAPPFADLVERAAGVLPEAGRIVDAGAPWRRSQAGRRFHPGGSSLAWAASLAVALTAGWLARSMVGTDRAASVGTEPAELLLALREREPAEGAEEAKAAAGEASVAAEQPTSPAGEGNVEEEGDGLGREPMAAGEPAARAPTRPVKEFRAEDAGQAAAKAAREADAAAPLTTRSLRAGGGPEGWRLVGREEAEALLGGAVRAVEGLPVLSMFARVTEGPPEVWTAQQLPSGHTLDLRQTTIAGRRDTPELDMGDRPAGDEQVPDAQARPAPESTWQQAYESLQMLRIDDFVIEARAPVSRDSLQSLLQRLRD